MTKSRGRQAAKSGLYGEATIESMMMLAGFPVVDYKKYDGTTPQAVRQYPCPHPYRPEKDVRAGANDFMLFSGEINAYCQVKNQNCSGTCDEKLSFAFDIARYAIHDKPFDVFALMLMGQWWPENPGIIEWAKVKCSEFEMLASGTRRKVTARVLVGPKDVSDWLVSIPKKETGNALFR
jgi:hypothetical protein